MTVGSRSGLYSSLKPLQEEVVIRFVTGHDVFAVLPMGFGKSFYCTCYACLPTTFYKLRQATPESSFALACCLPTDIAIMKDQVDSIDGIPTCAWLFIQSVIAATPDAAS